MIDWPGTRETLHRTAAYVRLHARRRPRHVAVMRDGAAISYATVDRDLTAMTQALRAFGLAAGQIAAIGCDDLYIQLLLVLGFETLGIVTGSCRPDEGPAADGLLAMADLVLLPPGAAAPACRRLVRLTEAWIGTALATPAAVETVPPAAVAAGLCLFRSSGTTGAPKLMLLTHGMMAARLARQRDPVLGLGFNSRTRFLAVLHFSVGSILMAVMSCFRLGATFMFGNGSLASVLRGLEPTHMTILPFQLRGLLATLPSRAAGPLLPGLTVQTIGARAPEDLRRQTREKLAGRLLENYGSNEVGAIGAIDYAGRLGVQAGIEMQVADQHGAAVPDGQIGFVRVRGSSVIAGYLGDPAATAKMFRDGWFYPGDLARRITGDRYQLVGRRSDVLNLGGRKLACAELESRILSCVPNLRDVAALQRNDGSSTPVTICLVASQSLPLPRLADTLRPIIGFPFSLQQVQHIPRNGSGKIRRFELHDALFKPQVPVPA